MPLSSVWWVVYDSFSGTKLGSIFAPTEGVAISKAKFEFGHLTDYISVRLR